MPYKTLHWIKLELRLMDDHRFFLMSERAQLTFIKLLILCGKCKNRVPKHPPAMNTLLRTNYTDKELKDTLDEIRKSFPKVLETNGFYHIKEFSKKTHWVAPEGYPGSSQEVAQESKIREDRDKNKIRIDIYKELFLKRHLEITGVIYPFRYGKDNVLLKELLVFEDQDCLALINEFFDSKGEWWSDKLSVGVFKTVIPQLIGRLRKKK